jgi:uncharacterized membrane protein YsdA (DUF1294 family)
MLFIFLQIFAFLPFSQLFALFPLLGQVVLTCLNFAAFMLFALDKWRARVHGPRISEKTLGLVTMMGGATGSILGQYFCRHKTRRFTFFLFNITGIAVLYALLYVYVRIPRLF